MPYGYGVCPGHNGESGGGSGGEGGGGSGGGFGGSGASLVTFAIPTDPDDSALHLHVECATDEDFTNIVKTVDTSTGNDLAAIKAFDGTRWLPFPVNGLGTPFYGFDVVLDTSKVLVGKFAEVYLRAWFTKAQGDGPDRVGRILTDVVGIGGGA
ncbi:MAG: hypothetical protein FWD53_09415 [Phycisphaerales bacterium]|nr:hypothetical protein [Phycisphaerales bacterium]